MQVNHTFLQIILLHICYEVSLEFDFYGIDIERLLQFISNVRNYYTFVQHYYTKVRFFISQLINVDSLQYSDLHRWPSSETEFSMPARWRGEQTVPHVI